MLLLYASILAFAAAAFALVGSPLPALFGRSARNLAARLDALGPRLAELGSALPSRGLAMAGAAAGSFFIYIMVGSWLAALTGLPLGALAPWALARVLERGRQAKASEQLAPVLESMAGSLRAGQSLDQALQSAAADAPRPVAAFLREPAGQVRLGRPPEQALEELAGAFAGRSGQGDWRLLATAVGVTRSTGGNLAEILDQLGESVRERQRLRATVEAMTAQGKLSGWIVGLLPVGLLAALQILDPQLVAPLFGTSQGLALLLAGLLMEAVGLYFLKRIVDVDV